MSNLYSVGERDIISLATYADHVYAMSVEKLHSKSDIAAELAFRDERIAELEKELESAMYFNVDVIRCLSKIAWEHNHDEIPAYIKLSKECIATIEAKQFKALKEQGKQCSHDFVCADNEKVTGAEVCKKCHLVQMKALKEQVK